MTNVIETTRLLLCRPSPEDILILKDLWRNESVRQFLGGILDEEIIAQRIEMLQKHWDDHGFGLAAVYEKAAHDLVGLCGLHQTEDGLEISYMFFPKHWGRGLAIEAVRISLEYGFTARKKDSIIAITQQANQRSCRLLETIGMKPVHNFMRFNALQSLYKMNKTEYSPELNTQSTLEPIFFNG